MRLQVKGKNLEVSPSIREYAERKLAKLAKQLAEQTQVEVELSEQRNPSIAASHVAEATIFTKGPTLRARKASPDMKASIDQLADKLERQGKRYRERRTVEPRRHAEHNRVEARGAQRGDAAARRMRFSRRRKPLHERLADAGGLDTGQRAPTGLSAEPPG